MRTRLALLAAVILGILAAVGVKMYVTQTTKRVKGEYKRVAIAIARRRIKPKDFLKDSDIRPVEVEVQAITEDHILFDARHRWLRLPLRRQVPAGKPILQSYFVEETPEADRMSGKIDTRWRAITIGTDQIAGVAGLITPNSRVDILGTFRVPGRGPESATTMVTKVIARNVQVVAVDHRTDLRIPVRAGRRGAALDYGYSSVTLHVTPLEASLLIFAQQAGKISFALRNSGDHHVGPLRPTDITMTQLDDLVVEAEQSRKEATTGTRTSAGPR